MPFERERDLFNLATLGRTTRRSSGTHTPPPPTQPRNYQLQVTRGGFFLKQSKPVSERGGRKVSQEFSAALITGSSFIQKNKSLGR